MGDPSRAERGPAAVVRIDPFPGGELEPLREVLAIERSCFSDPWNESSFASVQYDARVHFALAREDADGRICGYVVAWFVLDEGEIANVAVAPWAQGRGIGGALLDDAIAEAEQRGVNVLHLEVRESNHRAQALYASRGFRAVGRRRKYYQRPEEDAILLRRVAADVESRGGRGSGA